MPLLVTTVAPSSAVIPLIAGTSLVFLALLGGLAARADGAGVDGRGLAGHVLGSPSDGVDRRRRVAVWKGFLKGFALVSKTIQTWCRD